MVPVCSWVFYGVTQPDVLGSVQFAAARLGVGHVDKQLIEEKSWRLDNTSTSSPSMGMCGGSISDFV